MVVNEYICVDDKFSKPFKTYLKKDAVDNFNDNRKKVKLQWRDDKKNLTKNLWWLKERNKDFKNSTKCLIYDSNYLDNDVEVRDHCDIIREYRSSAHTDCNINLKVGFSTSKSIFVIYLIESLKSSFRFQDI